jgi:single-strand DNA-binding protein
MNKVFLVGHIGKIETKFSPSGTTICKLSLATNDRKKVGEEWHDETTWHNLVVFGKRADWLGKNAAKGNKLFVEGKIKTGSYTNKDGVVKYTHDILVDNYELMSAPSKGQSAAGAPVAFPSFDELSKGFKPSGGNPPQTVAFPLGQDAGLGDSD